MTEQSTTEHDLPPETTPSVAFLERYRRIALAIIFVVGFLVIKYAGQSALLPILTLLLLSWLLRKFSRLSVAYIAAIAIQGALSVHLLLAIVYSPEHGWTNLGVDLIMLSLGIIALTIRKDLWPLVILTAYHVLCLVGIFYFLVASTTRPALLQALAFNLILRISAIIAMAFCIRRVMVASAAAHIGEVLHDTKLRNGTPQM